MKRIKLYEEFSSYQDDLISEKLYQELLESGVILEVDSNDIDDEDREEGSKDDKDPDYDPMFGRKLTSGEKRILNRGLQLSTTPMMAACYLRAMGSVDKDNDKYIKNIQSGEDDEEIRKKLNILNFATPNGKWTYADLADAVGMDSSFTFQWLVGKFISLINGGDSYRGAVIAPKQMNAFKEFHKLSVIQVGQIAGEALQDYKISHKNRDNAETSNADAATKRVVTKAKMKVLAMNALDLARAWRKNHSDVKHAIEKGVQGIATENGVKVELVKRALDDYMRTSGSKLY